ncbi:TPA: DUF3265 domain-containing protein [Vibrio parahaemolyticus]|nr:DUF3265 domain-containing protein [Vibrio harveyi]EKO3871394.1 DUF3265 domain-containing protein [Vibrio harveyi]HBC3449566.1 DUF3265 domain-containing protein [Vibrio parahaemolyticus]
MWLILLVPLQSETQAKVLTNASRRIRNAWHFHHALILVIQVVCGNIALRCSPLKRALVRV